MLRSTVALNTSTMRTCIAVFALLLTAVQGTIVEISSGKLRGSFNGKYHSFLGIPFAEPPARFEAAVSHRTKWPGIRNATSPSVSCVKFSTGLGPNGAEDCLVINVFTPDIKPTRPLPVVFFLHGGAFVIGSAGDTAEEYVVQQDMVLAIPNYRLGPLGFLSSGDELISGNYALKDQQLALKWVSENIRYFGGDPKKVTITGFSAGGASVHGHLLNKKSWPYFSSAVSMSGVLTNPWAIPWLSNPRVQFDEFSSKIGCKSRNRKALKQCLQNRTISEIITATNALRDSRGNPVNMFGVVIESEKVPNAFLTEHPIDLMKKGQIANRPWIVGHCEREGTFTAATFMSLDENGNELISILNTRWLEIAPTVLFYKNSCVGCSEAMAKKKIDMRSIFLRNTYMQGQSFNVDSYRSLENMFTDELFVNQIKNSINLHRKYGKAVVYEYENRNGWKNTLGNDMANRLDYNFGADHGSDLVNVIPLKHLVVPAPTDEEQFISITLVKMIRELTISGVPKFDFKKLPVNNATHAGKMTIYKKFHIMEQCTDRQCTKNVYKNSKANL